MVRARWSAVRNTRASEYAVRFVFGGAATVLAGLVAQHWGPVAGGLFLAFPAIFPASVTLIASHEKRRKARFGLDGTCRGRMAASIEAAGAALGSIALVGFAFAMWKLLPLASGWLVLPGATLGWLAIAIALWALRKHRVFGRHLRLARQHTHGAR